MKVKAKVPKRVNNPLNKLENFAYKYRGFGNATARKKARARPPTSHRRHRRPFPNRFFLSVGETF
jgi:hypothetical protein